jgi:hypothetical protein
MMSQQVEVFTADGVLTGTWPGDVDLREVLETAESLELGSSGWTPLDRPTLAAPVGLPIDDVIAVVGDSDARLAVHANWHDVVLEAGPYRIVGLLPVLPGFDPGRALTRPGSTFLLLRDAKLELVDRPDAGELDREFVLVNRRVRHGAGVLLPGGAIRDARGSAGRVEGG